jgi:mannose-6-phosphate isomerase-like protein (cupin superfamily)
MSELIKKRFDVPDEIRPIPNGKVDVVKLGEMQALRNTFQPGWRWSESVKPIAKTDSCQVHHVLYILSGRIAVRMDDGTTTEFGPGDVGEISPGHDAWVVGDAPCVNLDFAGAAMYAKAHA